MTLCTEFCIVLQIFSLCKLNNFVDRLSAGLRSGPTCSTGAGAGAARVAASFQRLSPSRRSALAVVGTVFKRLSDVFQTRRTGM